jgi:hypothetical protein
VQVSHLPGESTEFGTERDMSVWDFRGWKSVDPGKNNLRTSLVNYYNYIHVKKERASSVLRLHYFSTGPVTPDLRCLTHNFKVLEETPTVAKSTEHKRAIEVDVAAEPIGEEFLVVIEETIWNGNQRSEDLWVQTCADEDRTERELSAIVLFPESKPAKDVRFLFSPIIDDKESEGESIKEPSTSYISKTGDYVYWMIPNPAKGVYRVHWKW